MLAQPSAMVNKSQQTIGNVLLLSSMTVLIQDFPHSKSHTCALQQSFGLYSTWPSWQEEAPRTGWGSAQD
jgi:hypothetical protein